MISITPTSEQAIQALHDARAMGVLHGSHTGGRGNLVGCCGEIIAAQYLNANRVGMQLYSHDLELADGRSVDVKTKSCNSAPQMDYACSVYAKNGKVPLKSDIVLFARATPLIDSVWLLGWLTTKQFKRRAEFIKAGTRDGAFIHRADGYHVAISRLNKMESLLAG